MVADLAFRSDRRLTQAEFFHWLQQRADSDYSRYELIQGRIVMVPPADFTHGRIGAKLVARLTAYVERHQLGTVLESSVGYDLPSGDTLEPDVSFVSVERLAAGPLPERGCHARLVPDLVIEILSRSTARRDRTDKKRIYAANGVREYWIVDPDRHAVTVFRRDGDAFDDGTTLSRGAVTSTVLPSLRLSLSKIFAE